jgi:flagellar biosynthesis/type III secretory pathway chaperone
MGTYHELRRGMIETTKTTQRLNQQVETIIRHLHVESKYLDSVIEFSHEMQSVLRTRRSTPSQPTAAVEPADNKPASSIHAERTEQLKQKLDGLKQKIAREFLPVLEGRKKLAATLKRLDPNQETMPSATALALRVGEPWRSQLKQLRSEIRNKLNQAQSISMGNQALLIYTLDFYNRLLTGLSQDYRQSNYYNSMGHTQNQIAGSLVKTNC